MENFLSKIWWNMMIWFPKIWCFLAKQTNVMAQTVILFLLFIFLYFTQFTSFIYKSLIIVVENFHKNHLIQHKKTQPVVVTRDRYKLSRTKGMPLFSFGKFTMSIKKSLIIVIKIFQKYHWIQHKKTQPVVVLSDLLIEPSECEIYWNTNNF